MYSLVDMAIYPVLFNQYLRYFIPGLDARLEWILSLAVIWGATWINLRGSVRVGRVSVIAGSFVMLGFLAMSFASIPRIAHIPWQPFASEDRQGLAGLGRRGTGQREPGLRCRDAGQRTRTVSRIRGGFASAPRTCAAASTMSDSFYRTCGSAASYAMKGCLDNL